MSGASQRLGPRARDILEDETNEIFFSVITAWEIMMKSRLGKLKVVGAPDDYVSLRLRMQRLAILSCTLDHVLGVANLSIIIETRSTACSSRKRRARTSRCSRRTSACASTTPSESTHARSSRGMLRLTL